MARFGTALIAPAAAAICPFCRYSCCRSSCCRWRCFYACVSECMLGSVCTWLCIRVALCLLCLWAITAYIIVSSPIRSVFGLMWKTLLGHLHNLAAVQVSGKKINVTAVWSWDERSSTRDRYVPSPAPEWYQTELDIDTQAENGCSRRLPGCLQWLLCWYRQAGSQPNAVIRPGRPMVARRPVIGLPAATTLTQRPPASLEKDSHSWRIGYGKSTSTTTTTNRWWCW